MNWLSSLLEDNSGGLSSIRLLMLAWFVVVLVVWAIVSLRTNNVADFPAGVVSLTGIIVGGKVVQRFGEKLPDDET